MTREEIYRDIEQYFGIVPSWMKSIPDEYLAEEFEIQKKLEFGETNIPNKYKELMGIAISAATRCDYCAFFHTEAAKFFGATEEEIQEANHLAKMSTGWSVYVHGMQIDREQFKAEVGQMIEYVKSKQLEPIAAM